MNSRRAARQRDVFMLRTTADLDTIDDLARLALQVKRHEKRLAVLAAPEALVRLIEAAGLADVVGVDPTLRSNQVARVPRPQAGEVAQPGWSEVGGKAEALEE